MKSGFISCFRLLRYNDIYISQTKRFFKFVLAAYVWIYFSRVRAYGPGIEPHGVVVGAPANFTVETISAGKGQVEVTVTNPHGQLEPVSIISVDEMYLGWKIVA